MPTYTIKRGEHLDQIAERFGFADLRTVWEDPGNAELRARRASPHVLLEGDEVFVPEFQPRVESRGTKQKHEFRARRTKIRLRVALVDESGNALADVPCTLSASGASQALVTDADGVVELEIPRGATSGQLVVDDPAQTFDLRVPLAIGALDPVDEPSGQRDRLRNLGYYLAEGGEPDPEALRSAVEEFQCDEALPVTGECDGATQAKLLERHGC